MAQRADMSRNRAATLIANGNVTVNGRREKASYRALAGDVVVIERPEPASREVAGENIPLSVAYEDEFLLVVDKPAGMVVHPAPGNWSGTLVNALIGRGGEILAGAPADRAGIIHRLDKETSGLLIVAKTDRAHRILGAALAARRVHR
ncbi:MAG TPA: RluA family pseudouridine synthase, partial [Gemmatimonadaceae bacterium]